MVALPMPARSPAVLSYLKKYRARVLLGFLCVLGMIAGSLLLPYIMRRGIDGFSTPASAWPGILRWAGLYLGIGVFTTVFAVGMRRLLLGLASMVEYDIRRDVFQHLTTLDTDFYQRERTGDIMTKMTSDLGAVRELVGQGLLQGSRIVVGFPVTFAVMLAIDVKLTVALAGFIPLISIVFFFLIRLIRKHYDRVQDQFSTITAFAQENFAGFRTIKGFGIEERQRGRFRDLNLEFIRRNMVLARIEEPVWPFMMLMFSLAQILLLWLGGRQIVEGRLTLGQFVQFQQNMMFLHWPMLALGWTSNTVQRGLASWKRIRTILDAVPGIRDSETTDQALAAVRGPIEFRDVSLRRGESELLSHINLTIPEGQCLAITGPTGGGKTLLAALIYRQVDCTEGRIEIGGHDVRAYPVEVLRRDIGVAPQEPFLFSDTLANNLGLGLVEMREADILRAADIAHLSADVEQFPQRFETILGERGVTLSGGQRQRTAIGRALARQPEILVLDDVFSAVDTQTEARILEKLLPELKGRTSIIISHRVSTLRCADRILVIEKGRIAQDGTHVELAATPGYYQELDEVQRLEARLETTA